MSILSMLGLFTILAGIAAMVYFSNKTYRILHSYILSIISTSADNYEVGLADRATIWATLFEPTLKTEEDAIDRYKKAINENPNLEKQISYIKRQIRLGVITPQNERTK